jgi:flagellar biosynthesis protein FlhG
MLSELNMLRENLNSLPVFEKSSFADNSSGMVSSIGQFASTDKLLVHTDQAEGLRRLLSKTSARIVAVVGARSGLGSTSVVVNLASIWASTGKDVLILDEHHTQNNVANTLALKPRYDLLNVVKRDKTLSEVMLRGGSGVQILPVARAMQSIPLMGEKERESLLDSLTRSASGADVILVDAAAREGNSVCASLSGDEPLLMVLNGTANGITESYAMLKQMALKNGRQSFDIMINQVNNEREAKTIFSNISQVAWQNLQVRLEYMGYIPVDEKLKRATQLCRSVFDAFPSAPSSIEFGKLAQRLINAKAVDDEVSGLARVMQRLIRQTRPNNIVASAIT